MLTLILTVLAVENLAEILLTKVSLKECLAWFGKSYPKTAAFFEELRAGFWDAFPTLKKMSECKYCLSWWIALFVSYWIVCPPMPLMIQWPITALAIHRLITLLAEFFDRYLNRAPLSVWMIPNEKTKED